MVEKEFNNTEDLLEYEQENMFNILNSIKDGIYIVSNNYDVEYVNAAFVKEFGPIKNRKCYEYTNDFSEPCPWCTLHAILEGKIIRTQRYYEKNSKTYDIIDTPLKKADGSISKLKIIRDISERKQLEERLKTSEENYRLLVENVQKEIIKRRFKKKRKLKGREPDEEAVELSQNLNKTVKFLSETSRLLKLSISNLANAYITDINRQRQINRLISEELNRLRKIDQMKDDLIRRVSHELKTPLLSIYTTSDLLLSNYKDQLDPKILDFINVINQGGERLKDLIDNLLDVYLIESNELEIEIKENDLSRTIKNAIDNIQELLLKRNHSLEIEVPNKCNHHYDSLRMEQVINNILINAIKYTPPEGEIKIELKDSENKVDIKIEDNGIGFSMKEQEQLFKKFGKIERFGQGKDIDTEGAGFGLYIANEIVKLHNGEILVESNGRNQGSTFTIRLNKKIRDINIPVNLS